MPTVRNKEELLYVIRFEICKRFGMVLEKDELNTILKIWDEIKVSSDGKDVHIHLLKKILEDAGYIIEHVIDDEIIDKGIYEAMEDEFSDVDFTIEYRYGDDFIHAVFTLPRHIQEYLVHGIWD